MLYIKERHNSPKIVIDFTEILFEMSGNSFLNEPLTFYQPVFKYIDNNFYQVKHSIHQWESLSLSLHFYFGYMGLQDFEMIRQIDWLFFQIQEFTTYIIWYYNPDDDWSVDQANDVKNTFLNQVRLVMNTSV